MIQFVFNKLGNDPVIFLFYCLTFNFMLTVSIKSQPIRPLDARADNNVSVPAIKIGSLDPTWDTPVCPEHHSVENNNDNDNKTNTDGNDQHNKSELNNNHNDNNNITTFTTTSTTTTTTTSTFTTTTATDTTTTRGGGATSKVEGGGAPTKKGTYKGKSKSENIHFIRHWDIPLHSDYIICDAFNICFSLYIIQDVA